MINMIPATPATQANQQNNQGQAPKRFPYDLIPMSYANLYPTLFHTKALPPVPTNLPWWYRADVTCPFHQGAPGNNIEHFYPLKAEVQKLVKSGFLKSDNL